MEEEFSEEHLTEEIRTALIQMSDDTIQTSLKGFVDVDDLGELDHDGLISLYSKTVLKFSLSNFVKTILKNDSSAISKLQKHVGCRVSKGEKELNQLVSTLQEKGILDLLHSLSDNLLDLFFDKLKLEDSKERDRMEKIKEISDELMLTGTQCFLYSQTIPVLRMHCNELDIQSKKRDKPSLVDVIMAEVFSLLGSSEEENEKDNKELSSSKKKPQKKPKKAAKNAKTSKKKPSKKQPKKEKKAKKEESEEEDDGIITGNYDKDGKWIAPPLEEIDKKVYDKEGLNSNFNVSDLHEYCKMRSLTTRGKKTDIVKTILHFLETGEKEGAFKRKRRPTGGASSPKKKPKTTDKETTD